MTVLKVSIEFDEREVKNKGYRVSYLGGGCGAALLRKGEGVRCSHRSTRT